MFTPNRSVLAECGGQLSARRSSDHRCGIASRRRVTDVPTLGRLRPQLGQRRLGHPSAADRRRCWRVVSESVVIAGAPEQSDLGELSALVSDHQHAARTRLRLRRHDLCERVRDEEEDLLQKWSGRREGNLQVHSSTRCRRSFFTTVVVAAVAAAR